MREIEKGDSDKKLSELGLRSNSTVICIENDEYFDPHLLLKNEFKNYILKGEELCQFKNGDILKFEEYDPV
jgi:hypothetical protein